MRSIARGGTRGLCVRALAESALGWERAGRMLIPARMEPATMLSGLGWDGPAGYPPKKKIERGAALRRDLRSQRPRTTDKPHRPQAPPPSILPQNSKFIDR